MLIGLKKTVEIDVKVLRLNAKCTDNCAIDVVDSNNGIVYEHDGYVPKFFPEQHYGDYLILDIEIETGRILNWKPPQAAELREFCEGDMRNV